MFRDVVGVNRKPRHEVLAQDLPGRLGIRALDLDFHVQTTGAQDRRIDHVFAVRCPDDDDVLQALHAVNLTQELRHDGVLDVTAHAAPPCSEQRIHFVKEDDDGHTFGRLLTCPLEDETDMALRFANVLIE